MRFKIPFFGKTKLLLAFEYGVVLADVAKQKGVEVTPELVKKAEKVIEQEFKTQSPTRLSVEMTQNLLAIFETDLSK